MHPEGYKIGQRPLITIQAVMMFRISGRETNSSTWASVHVCGVHPPKMIWDQSANTGQSVTKCITSSLPSSHNLHTLVRVFSRVIFRRKRCALSEKK